MEGIIALGATRANVLKLRYQVVRSDCNGVQGESKPAAPAPAAKKAAPPTPKPTPKPAAKTAAPADKELAAKREKAVAAALNNLGAAAKKVDAEKKPAASSSVRFFEVF